MNFAVRIRKKMEKCSFFKFLDPELSEGVGDELKFVPFKKISLFHELENFGLFGRLCKNGTFVSHDLSSIGMPHPSAGKS